MRFHQLSMGQRFEFEGEVYVRTKPLIAVNEASGHQRFIRRSALVKVLSQDAAAAVQDDAVNDASGITREAVVAAFDAFYASCLLELKDIEDGVDKTQLEQLREHFEEARQRFLDAVS